MSNRYGVKEIFNTLQGEGVRAGTRAVFVRFSGCNLWNGHPLHRDDGAGACARWCDTDFFKGTVLDTKAILAAMNEAWPAKEGEERWCVLTGGEPMLQVDVSLLATLASFGWHIAVETNGTVRIDSAKRCLINHLCVSPKIGGVVALIEADEVKVVLPGALPPEEGWTADALVELATIIRAPFYIVNPMDPPLVPKLVGLTVLKQGHDGGQAVDEESADLGAAFYQHGMKRCIDFVMSHPNWRLGVQLHKLVGLA